MSDYMGVFSANMQKAFGDGVMFVATSDDVSKVPILDNLNKDLIIVAPDEFCESTSVDDRTVWFLKQKPQSEYEFLTIPYSEIHGILKTPIGIGSYISYYNFFDGMINDLSNPSKCFLRKAYEDIYGVKSFGKGLSWCKNIPEITHAVKTIEKSGIFNINGYGVRTVNANRGIHEILRQLLLRFNAGIVYYDDHALKQRNILFKAKQKEYPISEYLKSNMDLREVYWNGVRHFITEIGSFNFN